MPTLASLLTYGTVTDSFFAEIQDTDLDDSNLPDLVDVGGTVTFTPGLAAGEVLLFTSVPATLKVMPVVAAYDDQGRLSLNGQPFVKLLATDNVYASRQGWTWTATFTGLTVNGVPVSRSAFSFLLPGSSLPVDLAQLQPVTTQNGALVVKGDPGQPGAGITLRGTYTGSSSSVLPTGYASAQNGYTFRVHTADLTYDHLWVWVWTGSAGSYVDAGPFNASAIDDTVVSAGSTWSSSKIATIANGAGGNVFIAAQNPATSVWPTRAGVLAAYGYLGDPNVAVVIWTGDNFPPETPGYALPGRTVTVNGSSMYVEDGFEQRQAG